MGPPPPLRNRVNEVRLDHLILGVSDLGRAADVVSTTLGFAPVPGGRHVGRGTANRLMRLGPDSYLELLGPDPDQTGTQWIAPEAVGVGRLIGWALRSSNIEEDAAQLRRTGFDLGPIGSMQREAPQGLLEWRMTETRLENGVMALPFLIDWGASPHPTESLPCGPELLSLRVLMPDPERLDFVVEHLGGLLVVEGAREPRLEAVIRAADRTQVILSGLETEVERRV